MSITRRALTGLTLTLATPTLGQSPPAWPNRPVRVIVPLTAGGAADILARLVTEHLQSRFGKPFVVENRPGAGGAIGMEAVARAAPDGHTVGMGNIAANAILPALQRGRLPYRPVEDFAPITLVAITPSVLVINPRKVPVTDLPGLISYLRANPGRLNYGSSGVGTTLHLGMEMLLLAAGATATHIPFRGSSEMITQLVSGQVDLAIDGFPTAMPHVQAGRLRALAVPTPERLPFAPDLPAVAEVLPGVGLSPWHGLMAPAGTPDAIVQPVSEEIGILLRRLEVVERLAGLGMIAAPSTPAAFRQLMVAEEARFRDVIAQTGITPD